MYSAGRGETTPPRNLLPHQHLQEEAFGDLIEVFHWIISTASTTAICFLPRDRTKAMWEPEPCLVLKLQLFENINGAFNIET
ncbi:hypothetical protein NPIL_408061 [Nephila pilipes]|uniref:Uncharacterized protein n=1 Tax=Nephila pilipes TaxID=299642 RepID=A0A8X6QRV4_NEPPI|nr:hypothetical protein NPIL_408061 [Nephila pilipes]